MTEPRTAAGRALRGKMCWAFHALSTTEHNPDCEIAREGILAIEAEASGLDVERLAAALEAMGYSFWKSGMSTMKERAEDLAAAYARNEAGEEEG